MASRAKYRENTVRREKGKRGQVCPLPLKSPWLNRIEPKWVHAKRAVAEPDRLLSKAELIGRICYHRTGTLWDNRYKPSLMQEATY